MRLVRAVTIIWIAGITVLPAGVLADGKGPISVERPWARATILKSRPAAAYLTLSNTGASGDRLIEVTSPVANHVSIHATSMRDGMMKMAPLESLEVKPGKSVVLKPGETHLMLTDLRRSLRKGETFPMTLRFEKAGIVEIIVPILSPGAKGPD